jgi:PIN domain nuclease of toxin-antitoxin system
VRGGLLIDTCALIWIAALEVGAPVSPVERALDEARDEGLSIHVSRMSAWEIGMLAAKGRLSMTMAPQRWLDQLMASVGMLWADLSVEVLLAASVLPGHPHGDPADRIIVATAREYGLRLVTRDRKILDYAAQGHVMALAC